MILRRHVSALAMLCLIWAGAAGAQDPLTPVLPQDPAPVITEPEPEAVPPPAGLSALEFYVDGVVESLMAQSSLPGVIVSVVYGNEVFAKGFGVIDRDAGTPATGDGVRMEIGSITKLFTWVAVMMLEQEGLLDLHADVNTYLREIQVGQGSDPITLAQVMSHRPGLEETFEIFQPAFTTMARPQALAATEPRQVLPRGEATAYSNWGVALAGQVVEDVAGVPFEEFLYERILLPLGMNDTTYLEEYARPDQPPLSVSYRPVGGELTPVRRIDIGAFGPAGSMASTAADMARFMQFLLGEGSLDGTQLLSPETFARMRTRLYDDRPEAADVAHGFFDWQQNGVALYGHGGSLNEFLSNLVIAPELGVGVFIVQNSPVSVFPTLALGERVVMRLAAEAGLTAAERPEISGAEALAREVAGRYLGNRRHFEGPEQLFGGMNQVTVRADDGGEITVTSYLRGGLSRYHPVAPDVYENRFGDRIAFARNESGRVFRMSHPMGAETYDQVRITTDPYVAGGVAGFALLMSLAAFTGLWWRAGRRLPSSTTGRVVGGLHLLTALAVFLLLAAMVMTVMQLNELGLEIMFDYPPPWAMRSIHVANATVVLAALSVLAVIPAWTHSGWPRGRKIHYALFAFAMLVMVWAMVNWDIAYLG